MVDYLPINALASGIAGGIIGAITIFWSTLNAYFGKSKAMKFLEESIWKSYGYKISVGGAFWGAVLGFIYGFLIWLVFSLLYNWMM